MLRTGQSLLANALIHMYLGRGLFLSCQKISWLIIIDCKRPPYPVPTADYATYVQILTWFLDTPVQEAIGWHWLVKSWERMLVNGLDLV